MSDLPAEIDLRCAKCGHTEFFDVPRMLRSLQSAGKLKRSKDPPQAMVVELFHATIGEIRCTDCGGFAYEASPVATWDDDAHSIKRCETCGAAIDPDRLEIFPETTLCTACQRKQEANPSGSEEPEFCPRCGAIMKLRGSSRGVAKYILSCPDCGYR